MRLLALSHESAGYQGHTVLHDITLSIDAGERVALVGESGAGKSTLLQLIQDRCGAAATLIPQDPGLVEALSVFHNVYIGGLDRRPVWRNLRNLVWPEKPEVARISALLRQLRLEDKIFESVGELSGGQRQRTAVARALYQGTGMLLADEPVSAVDEHQGFDILSFLGSAFGTVVVSLHDRTQALAFATRVIGLKGGRIVVDSQSSGISESDLDLLYKTAA